ncbi:hypothetical protein FHW83_003455 [Duganella sp. SG902]|uniref:type III secretion system protein SctP n=1 Tax=Duganella sp. SG902 TaxID=2587016 RepID=UPI00159DFADE|nr:type III secretion system protein SctP [Duganella sp. SG902]NVM77637.1 hypothetical protein [Duganella sp. SG902]
MAIKPTDTHTVRLLPRSDTPALSAARQRALRLQFSARLAAVDHGGAQDDKAEACLPGEEQDACGATGAPGGADGVAPETGHAPSQAPATATVTAAPAHVAAETPLSRRIARACLRDEHDALRTARLATIIAQFCNAPAILDSGNWELQIEIDPALLAATRLHLHLSSCRLLLRFESADRDARGVILDNSKELQQRLSALLPARIEVDIVCW